MSILDARKNFAISDVSTGYDNSATSIVLATGGGAKFPDPSTDGAFNLVWWDYSTYKNPSDDTNVEIVRCTARTGDTLTITRGQEGTSASAKNTGTQYKVMNAITGKMIDDIESYLNQIGGETFESVSKNLKSYPYEFNYTGTQLTSINYTLPSGTIRKTLNYTGTLLTSIVLSGDTPSGIDLTKTLGYTGTTLSTITYS